MTVYAYDEVRDKIQTGDMLEFAGSSFLAKTIRFFTKQGVNHTASALSMTDWNSYVGNRKFLIEALDTMVVRPVSQAVQKKGVVCYWTPLLSSLAQRAAIGSWMLDQLGKPYDYKGLVSNAFGKVNADAKRFYCSELYFFGLVIGGVLPQFRAQYEINGSLKGIVDSSDKPVVSPRPGEFVKRFPGIFGETAMLLK